MSRKGNEQVQEMPFPDNLLPVPAKMLESSKTQSYAAGDTIVAQGERCSEIHYIQDGIVKLTMLSSRGRVAVVGILGQGDFFGEECIIGPAAYSTSAVALVPTTTVAIRRDSMLRLLNEEKAVSSHFLNYVVARNRRIQQNLIDHVFNSSEKRLARILLLLASYQNSKKGVCIFGAISQDNLAEMVGTTRQRINFFMNKFRKLGYIQYNGEVKIHDSLRRVLED
jgi:CRP/FNR family transcriptional regulator, cyclic AMP receptor protein